MSQGVMSGFFLRTALRGYLNSWIASVVIPYILLKEAYGLTKLLLENEKEN